MRPMRPSPGSAALPGPLVLLIEDDDSTRTSVARDLGLRGFRVDEAPDGRTALERWELHRPDLVLVDLGLPDMDGLRVIRAVRRDAATPVIVLSARGEESTKIEALELGADDYVTKPFAMGELQARIRAVLRRATGPAGAREGRLEAGPVVLDGLRHEVTVGGQVADLTPREFEILRVLMSNPGRLITHGRLLRAVWGEAYQGERHYVHVQVSLLRRKLAALDPTGEARSLIVTEPGVGYRVAATDREAI
jgi:two-component system, OmpR family, KDP operon response regulator KdpE